MAAPRSYVTVPAGTGIRVTTQVCDLPSGAVCQTWLVCEPGMGQERRDSVQKAMVQWEPRDMDEESGHRAICEAIRRRGGVLMVPLTAQARWAVECLR